MKVTTFKPRFIATGLAIGLAMISQAYAAPQVFTVDPPLTAPFQADSMSGFSSELLHGDLGAGTLTATSGWLSFTGFSLGGVPLSAPLTSRIGIDYGLYVTFNLVGNYSGGAAFATPGSNYNLSSLNFQMWRDDGVDTIFTPAATPGTEATVAVGAADVLLGSGSLITGVAGFNPLLGAFLNATTTFATTVAGDLFFTAPVPFYNLAFSALNNTSQAINTSGGCAGLVNDCTIGVNAAGIIDFNRVPEPATLALLGMGLMGVGISLRKRKTT